MTSRISQTWHRISQQIRKVWPKAKDPQQELAQRKARLANQWGLEPHHLDSLRHLQAHPSYKAYLGLLESVADRTFLELCKGLPHDQYLAKCGELQMLQRIRDLPELLTTKVTELETDRARIDREPDAGIRRFLNTPWYDSALADLAAGSPSGNGASSHTPTVPVRE